MTVNRKHIRSMQDIRPLSGRGDQLSHHYKVYMKVACLELEKFRRGQEKRSALFRLENIDARFKEIEAEKADLLRKVSSPRAAVPGGPARSVQASASTGFKLKY